MPPPPSHLPDELLEEIFMRLPADEPACLVRASLACKHWLGLLTGPALRSRYRGSHGPPSMLGFFYCWKPSSGWVDDDLDPFFVSTSKFIACIRWEVEEEDESEDEEEDEGEDEEEEDEGEGEGEGEGEDEEEDGFEYEDWWYPSDYYGYEAWDCRHGRAVLGFREIATKLVVLDPVTGRWRELDVPQNYNSHGAAVLCAVPGCHHRTCHQGPFRVVFVGIKIDNGEPVAYAYLSLPMTDKWIQPGSQWSEPCPGLHLGFDASFQEMPPVFTQDALYFMLKYDDDDTRLGILTYGLRSKCLSLVDAPLVATHLARSAILMGMEDGSLGFAHLDGLTLNLWSRKMGSDGITAWTQHRVINLEELLPIQNLKKRLRLIGSVESGDIIFVTTDLGIYKISLESLQRKKIWNRKKFHALVPYMSFYDPPERATPCDAAH